MLPEQLKPDSDSYVVLLHGLGRDPRMMQSLHQRLSEIGYHAYSDHYLSTKHSIEELADHVHKRILKACPDPSRPLYFVTHSLGGILLRAIMKYFELPNLARAVMIAPPNKGSEVAEFLKRFNFFESWYGPAGQQLGTRDGAIHHTLGPVDFELGVIAGNRTVDPWFSWFLFNEANDGKVSIEGTKIQGMTDHIILPASHTFITKKPQTIYQAAYFLKHGCFAHST